MRITTGLGMTDAPAGSPVKTAFTTEKPGGNVRSIVTSGVPNPGAMVTLAGDVVMDAAAGIAESKAARRMTPACSVVDLSSEPRIMHLLVRHRRVTWTRRVSCRG